VLLNIFGIRRKGHDAAQLTQIHRYHNEIVAAIARQDPQEAMRLLGEHIRVSRTSALQEYDERAARRLRWPSLSGPVQQQTFRKGN
jgi:DNA-binding GntR family transcriptional regulator